MDIVLHICKNAQHSLTPLIYYKNHFMYKHHFMASDPSRNVQDSRAGYSRGHSRGHELELDLDARPVAELESVSGAHARPVAELESLPSPSGRMTAGPRPWRRQTWATPP
jgi:hypothetical protein